MFPSDENVALDREQDALLWLLRNADAQQLVQGMAVDHFGRRRRPRYNTHAVRSVEAPGVGNGALHDGRLSAASPPKQPNVLAFKTPSHADFCEMSMSNAIVVATTVRGRA